MRAGALVRLSDGPVSPPLPTQTHRHRTENVQMLNIREENEDMIKLKPISQITKLRQMILGNIY